MASLNGLETRFYLAKGVVGQVADDQPVAIRLKYVGAGTVTSVTVTTATNIVTVTTEGTKTYAFATYTTIGAVVAAINKDGIFIARALDIRNTDASTSTIVTGAITISTDGHYDLMSDTSAASLIAYCLTPDRQVGMNTKLRASHRVHLQDITYNVTLGGGADSNAMKVYERDLQSGIETLIYQKTPTSGSSTTINFAGGYGKITGGDNKELVVICVDATSVTGSLTVTGISE